MQVRLSPLHRGHYTARLAQDAADHASALALRTRAFQTDHADSDAFDEVCAHVVIEDTRTQHVVCCFRMMFLEGGGELCHSYSAQFYDLEPLVHFPGRMVELGRFCIDPAYNDPDILRIAWGAMTRCVDENRVEMLFGCSSFAGTETADYLDAFAMLKARYLGPKRWLPQVKAPDVFRFAARLRRVPDARKAMLGMPPLLKTYLMMGGWVSDHAVVDRQMNTLHVFTGVEIGAIPAARKRVLRAVVG